MPTSTWKGVEAEICEWFITLPPEEKAEVLEHLRSMRDSMRAKKEGSKGWDCKHEYTEPFIVSVKHGKRIPITPARWMEEAEAVTPKGRIAVLVMHPHGARIGDSLVVMRLEEFRDLYL